MGIIYFNGNSSDKLNVVVEVQPNYITPEKDYTELIIPGRNGTVLIDNETFKNVERRYDIAVANPKMTHDFPTMATAVVEWLLSASGYCRLEDSYEPDYYRLATLSSSMDINNIYNMAGRCTIAFNCKPQKYLKIGETPLVFNKNTPGTIINPTKFESKPLIKVYGDGPGTIRINNQNIKVDLEEYVIIDSDVMDCCKNTLPLPVINNKTPVYSELGFNKLYYLSDETFEDTDKDYDTVYFVRDIEIINSNQNGNTISPETVITHDVDALKHMSFETFDNEHKSPKTAYMVGEGGDDFGLLHYISCNNKVELHNGFPVLKPGNNKVQFLGNITKVEVIPRWWTI